MFRRSKMFPGKIALRKSSDIKVGNHLNTFYIYTERILV